MRAESEIIQLALNPGDSVRVETGRVTITRQPRSKQFLEVLRKDSFKKWWIETNMSNLIQTAAQVWINNKGAQIGMAAGADLAWGSHQEENDLYNQKLHQAFEKARGRSFGSSDIVDRVIHEARELQRKSAIQIPWYQGFTQDLINILGVAWALSESRISRLKTKLYQEKLPSVNLF